jgi:uncharacterized protein involved in exopolysaccharide biosynthesis
MPKEITFIDLYKKIKSGYSFVLKKKFLLTVFLAVGIAIGVSYTFIKSTNYESKLTFIVEEAGSSRSIGALSSIASSFGIGGIGGSNGDLYTNQINLINYLKSQTIIEDALLSEIDHSKKTFAQQFIEIYGWKNDFPAFIKFKINENRNTFSVTKDSVLSEVYRFIIEKEMLSIFKQDEEGGIIQVNFVSKDDTLSRFLPEKLLEIVAKRYVDTKTKTTKQNVDLLQYQTDSVRKVLNQSMIQSAVSTDQVFGLNPSMNVRRVPSAKAQVDIQASTILLGELIKNLELTKMQLKDQTPIIEIIDSPRFPLEENKPSKILTPLIGGFVSLFIGIIVLALKEFFMRLQALAS